jgi:hypothetical protein
MSMRVERVTVDKVREQMEALKRKREGIANYGEQGGCVCVLPWVHPDAPWSRTDFDKRVEAARQEEEERKRGKKAARKAEPDDMPVPADADADAGMAAAMGFRSFGSSKPA